MSDVPVLKRLILAGDPRLPFLDLDLVDPATGTPLDAVCLIGPNGCGKSTLLARICEAVSGLPRWIESEGFALAKFALEEEDLYLAKPLGGQSGGHLFRTSIEETELWERLAESTPGFDELTEGLSGHLVLESVPGFQEGITFWFDGERSLVDGEDAGGFVPFIERLLREREEALHRFLREARNRDKTVAEVEQDFEAHSPQALTGLARTWNRLLEPSGLQVDFGAVEGPFFDRSGPIPVDRLGAALAKVLLRTGLAQLRSHATVPSTFFCDDLGEGLHPRLAEAYLETLRGSGGPQAARIFITTHSPLLAARFAPAARLRIAPTADGRPWISRGHSGAGSIALEIPGEEFDLAGKIPAAAPEPEPEPEPALSAPAGPETRERRSSRLRRAIRESENEKELADLIDEVISIGED